MKKLLIGVPVALVTMVLLVFSVIHILTENRLQKDYSVEPGSLKASTDAAVIKEGKRLFMTRGCADCHGENLAGRKVVEDGGAGLLFGSNLTRGKGGVGDLSDSLFLKAVRHGLSKENKPLKWMPSDEYNGLSQEELTGLYSFMRSVPAVDAENPKSKYGPVIRILLTLNKFQIAAEKIDHTRPVFSVKPAADEKYGAYLGGMCIGCHGPHYSGGPVPGVPPSFPPASNITRHENGLKKYTEADFTNALTKGKRPDGRDINPFMPWKNFAQMTPLEIKALWLFVSKLPARETGNR